MNVFVFRNALRETFLINMGHVGLVKLEKKITILILLSQLWYLDMTAINQEFVFLKYIQKITDLFFLLANFVYFKNFAENTPKGKSNEEDGACQLIELAYKLDISPNSIGISLHNRKMVFDMFTIGSLMDSG